MEELNEQMDGQLETAIKIFTNQHPKPFLHQLVSGQLDMDRMDYLNRDRFFTGVSEGVIGYHRIIKMLDVRNGELVVEEKGIYSIEKFLIARLLMYWQVYLHKTSLVVEQMLIKSLLRAKLLAQSGFPLNISEALAPFLYEELPSDTLPSNRKYLLDTFSQIDDYDVFIALKSFVHIEDKVLSMLSNGIVNRRLFRIKLNKVPFERDYVESIRQKLKTQFELGEREIDFVLIEGQESNSAYSTRKNEIKILYKDDSILPLSEASDQDVSPKIITKHYLCFPKSLS